LFSQISSLIFFPDSFCGEFKNIYVIDERKRERKKKRKKMRKKNRKKKKVKNINKHQVKKMCIFAKTKEGGGGLKVVINCTS
jgi:hypothetical protein